MLLSLDAIIRSLVRSLVIGQASSRVGDRGAVRIDRRQDRRRSTSTCSYARRQPSSSRSARGLRTSSFAHRSRAGTAAVDHCPSVVIWLNSPPQTSGGPDSRHPTELSCSRSAPHLAISSTSSAAEKPLAHPGQRRREELSIRSARVSPTNFGLLLNARQAAYTFGFLTLPEFAGCATIGTWTPYDRWRSARPHLQLVRHADAEADPAARGLVGGQRQPGGLVLHAALRRGSDAAPATAGCAAVVRHPRSACAAGHARCVAGGAGTGSGRRWAAAMDRLVLRGAVVSGLCHSTRAGWPALRVDRQDTHRE